MNQLFFTNPKTGLNMSVWTAGDSSHPLLIFLHGFPEHGKIWEYQLEYFSKLGYFVVAPDQRGYGETEKPYSISAYSLDLLAQDVLGVIEYFQKNDTDLVGHDWGAGVSYWAVLKYPEKFRSVTIINVPHLQTMKDQMKKNKVQRKKSRYMFFFQLPWIPEFMLRRAGFKLLERSLVKTSKKGSFTDEDILSYKEAWSRPGAIRGMLNWYRAVARVRTEPIKNAYVKIPSLVIWGAKDPFMRRELAELSMKYHKNGRLVFFENNTHWVHHEKPLEVSKEIEDFLAQNRKSSS
jgi:pimeloyl-ACP methyl ester carboxylesterase